MRNYIALLASLGLAYVEELLTGDGNKRKTLVQRYTAFGMSHLRNFADALDLSLVLHDDAGPLAEPEITDDPCRESMGYRIIRPHGGPGECSHGQIYTGEGYFGHEPLRATGCIFWHAKRFLLKPDFRLILEELRHVPREIGRAAMSRVERETLTQRLGSLLLPLEQMMRLTVQFGSDDRTKVWSKFLNERAM